ncbi:hypothetical protein GCM10023091_11850 [Ravibacter arvi]|uniref:DUF4834 domain-containing protein n=1 Tax=Ravibacter arvi TaxID=2051041 RepID=A0ABP8LUU7_9BACT
MFKFILNILLIFIALIIFVPVFRRFLLHLLVGRKLVKEQRRANEAFRKREEKDGIHVDHQPRDRSGTIKGGDYIDYEEIKDK